MILNSELDIDRKTTFLLEMLFDFIINNTKMNNGEILLKMLTFSGDYNTVYHVTSRGISKIAMGSILLQNNKNPFAAGKRHMSTNSFLSPKFSPTFSSTPNLSTSSKFFGQKSFSHIIVGAGSAGCVLSNRITEDRH